MQDTSWQIPQGDWTDDEKRVLGGYWREDPQKAIDYVVRKNNEKAKEDGDLYPEPAGREHHTGGDRGAAQRCMTH